MNRDILRILENAGEGMPPGYRRERVPSFYFNKVVPPGLYGKVAFSPSPTKHNFVTSYGYTL